MLKGYLFPMNMTMFSYTQLGDTNKYRSTIESVYRQYTNTMSNTCHCSRFKIILLMNLTSYFFFFFSHPSYKANLKNFHPILNKGEGEGLRLRLSRKFEAGASICTTYVVIVEVGLMSPSF